MKKIIPIFVIVLMAAGCSYDPMPPKTADGTDNFTLPKGDIPNEAELQTVSAVKAEYEQWIEDNS